MSLYGSEWSRLRSELPQDVQETLTAHETNGTTDDPAYQEANAVFDHQHICRLNPWPDYLLQSLENLQVAEFDNADWDFQDHLKEIVVPTLITSGKYDTVTPMMAKILHEGIDGSEWVFFEGSSHYAHAEETEHFLTAMDGFLTRVEQNQ